MSIAFLIASGMGTPISPAFSIMDRSSLAVYAKITEFRTKFTPKTTSSLLAIITNKRVMHFLVMPLNPAFDSNAPFGVLRLFLKIPPTHKPLIKSTAINKISVFNSTVNPPKSRLSKLLTKINNIKNLPFN